MPPALSNVEEPLQPPEDQSGAGGEGGPDSFSLEIGVAPDDWAITLTGAIAPMAVHDVVQDFWEEEAEGEEPWPEVEDYRNVRLEDVELEDEEEEEVEDLTGEFESENGEEEENSEAMNDDEDNNEEWGSEINEDEISSREEILQELCSDGKFPVVVFQCGIWQYPHTLICSSDCMLALCVHVVFQLCGPCPETLRLLSVTDLKIGLFSKKYCPKVLITIPYCNR